MASKEILLQRVQGAKVDAHTRDTAHNRLQGRAEGGRAVKDKTPDPYKLLVYGVKGAPMGGGAE